MRAWVLAAGDALVVREVPSPVPGPGEVRVRVRAFGINRADLLQRRGLHPAPPGAPADIPGLEFAGEVDAVSPAGAGTWRPGDRVMGLTAGGAYAEYVVVPAGQLLPMPPRFSFTGAAAVPEAFLTAFDALERVSLGGGEWLLVHAVGSGVGTATVQLARARGAHTVGTSRTAAKLDRARPLGLDVGLDPSGGDFVEPVRRATAGGAHAAVDLVGGPLLSRTLEALRPRGRLVLVGLTAGGRADVDLGLVLRHRLRLEGTVLRSRPADEKADLVRRFAGGVLPLLAAGTVRPVVDRVWPFDGVEEALATMAANRNFGKLVVEIGGESG
jgi:putative PIG3 family NAD(P)H quinone oxidoreductase